MLNIHFNINICLIWIAYRSGGHIFTFRLFFSSDVNKECQYCVFIFICHVYEEFLLRLSAKLRILLILILLRFCMCEYFRFLAMFSSVFKRFPMKSNRRRTCNLFIWIGNLKGDNFQALYAYEYVKTINLQQTFYLFVACCIQRNQFVPSKYPRESNSEYNFCA